MTSLTQADGFITAEWTLPDANTSSLGFEISDTEDSQFPVLVQVLDPSATSLTTPDTCTPRTWYVRVVTTTTPAECDPDPFAQLSLKDVSTNSMSVNVPQPSSIPPTNVVATQEGGRISVTWSLNPGSDAVEIESGPVRGWMTELLHRLRRQRHPLLRLRGATRSSHRRPLSRLRTRRQRPGHVPLLQHGVV